MNASQCRAARALVDWTQQELAEAAHVGNATIRNFEAGRSAPQSATIEVLRQALQRAGVIFLEPGQDAPGGGGVRLREQGA